MGRRVINDLTKKEDKLNDLQSEGNYLGVDIKIQYTNNFPIIEKEIIHSI